MASTCNPFGLCPERQLAGSNYDEQQQQQEAQARAIQAAVTNDPAQAAPTVGRAFPGGNKAFPTIPQNNAANFRTGLNAFRAVMYINLDDRKDRKKVCEAFLADHRIHSRIRVAGVNDEHNGHLGCVRSHIKAVKLAMVLRLDSVLIMEDDFNFSVPKEEVSRIVDDVLRTLKGDWDVIHIGFSSHVEHQDTSRNGPNVKRLQAANAAAMYGVNKAFYPTLLANMEEAENLLITESQTFTDVYCTPAAFDQHWMPLQAKSKWFGIIPGIGYQNGSASSIMDAHALESASCKDWGSRVVKPSSTTKPASNTEATANPAAPPPAANPVEATGPAVRTL